MKDLIRVLVADDSPFVCRLLTNFLQSVPDITVIGTAHNGQDAFRMTRQLNPDVVTLDIEMPVAGGIETLEWIMQKAPTPVVVISGVGKRGAGATLRALELGAIDFILKFSPDQAVDPEILRGEIIAKVRAAARIRVVRTVQPLYASASRPAPRPNESSPPEPRQNPAFGLLIDGVVAIGASTGGPLAIRQLLEGLPLDFQPALLIVQHLPSSFTPVFASLLQRHSAIAVKEAEDGEPLMSGRAYVAPGDHHMLIDARSRIMLNRGPSIGGHRPSIDVTMQSAAQVYGARAKGVVLTGMGDDGCLGLLAIMTRGGITYAQDEASCVVNGMPSSALARGVVNHVGTPHQIARMLSGSNISIRKLESR